MRSLMPCFGCKGDMPENADVYRVCDEKPLPCILRVCGAICAFIHLLRNSIIIIPYIVVIVVKFF